MKYIYISIIVVLLAGCAANQNNVKEYDELDSATRQELRDKALEYFMNGSIAEMKGAVADAILEYQEALKLDPSAGVYYALGNAYFKINRLAPALHNAREAVKLSPVNLEYNSLLGRIYLAANQKDSAEVVYNRIIGIDSTDYTAYYNLGYIYEEKQPSKALTLYKKLLSLIGPEWNVLIKIAELNERLGNVEETISTVEELLELNPSSLEIQKILIESYIKSNKMDKALSMLNETMTLFPDDPSLIEMKAGLLIQEGKWIEGAAEYMKFLRDKEISFEVKIGIASSFLTRAIKDSALIPTAREFFEYIDRDTLDWQVKASLGEIAVMEKKDSAAIEYFKSAAELSPYNSQIWLRLGGILFDNGRYEEAAGEMKEAVKNFPDDYVLNLILGLSLAQQSNHAEAEPYLAKAVKINSGSIDALAAYGFTLNQLKKVDEAIVYINKALEIDSSNVQLWGILGMIYDGKEMWDKCDYSYEKAVSLDSTNALILNNYAYSLSERDLQLDRALKMARNAVSQEPENSSYLDTIGWVYFKLGDYEIAKEYIEKAIAIDGDNATLIDHLGDVYFKLGNKEKAVQLWNDAFKLDSTNESIKLKIDKGAI